MADAADSTFLFVPSKWLLVLGYAVVVPIWLVVWRLLRGKNPGIALLGVVVLAHAPLIGLHLFQMWPKAYYQYMPLVPIGAAVLIGRNFRDSSGQADFGFKTQFLTACGLLFLAASVVWYSPWLSVISLVINLGVAARLTCG